MTSLTTTNCSICFQNVTPQQPAIILNKSKTTECKLHSACFNCIECSAPLLNTPGARTTTTLEYRAKGGDLDNALNDTAVVPLCNEHYLKKFGTFCSHCNEIVTGSFFEVGTEKYHPNCMLCSNCSIPVNTKDEPAKISNDIIRCTNCFNDVMYDKCVGCRKPCNAQFIKYGTVTKDDGTTEEGKYHPDCFSCTNCDVSLGGLKFIPSKNNPNSIFCESCYQQVNAPICTICSHCILETNFLNLEGGKPCHELCLSCSICSMPARDPATDQLHIHSQDGVFYCKTHYVEKFAEKCFGCSFGIDGTYLNAMNKRWHKECFCCFACGDALTKANGGSTEYCVENNEVYCLNDWDGLFGNGLNGSAENTSVAKKKEKEEEEEEEDQEDQEDQDYQEDQEEQGKEEVNRDTTYTTDQLNLPGDDTAATSSTSSTASTASTASSNASLPPPKYTAPLPPPRKKPNSRHVRKKSQIDEIRTSALATSALCRSSTGGLGAVSETKKTATATNNNNEKKTKPRKTSKKASLKNKKDPQWGNMIGTLFSQGIGHAVRTHNERKGKADLALIEKKEYKARFPYRLENSREMIHNDAEETSSNSNVINPLNGVDVGQNRSARTTTIKSKFDFEDFAPSCFTHLRTTWGISDVNYMNSMCRHPLSGGQVGEGKSGMLFFFSYDKKYIVKTVTTSELPFFLRIMNDYHSHMLQCPNSLLSRFMGLYRMKVDGNKAMTVVVMQNLFYTNLKIHSKFDLKGSTVKRFVTDEEIIAGTTVLKDRNFKTKIYLEQETKKKFLETIKIDAHFLRESNIMDYSILLGINNNNESNGKTEQLPDLDNPTYWQQEEGGIPFPNGIYFMGIIDILQKYNLKKKLENAYKSRREKRKGKDPEAISAVGSAVYSKRFVKYVESLVA